MLSPKHRRQHWPPFSKAGNQSLMKMPSALSRSVMSLAIVAVLSGCSTLPRDGPTGSNVEDRATTPDAAGAYAIVDLTYATSERIKALPPKFLGSLAAGGAAGGQSDLIGVGDTLAIAIFEPGGSLFSTGSSSGNGSTNSRSGTQGLPPIAVDSSGAITVPFAGVVTVAGLSPTQAASAIRRALAGKAANPQVVVSIANNAYNAVTVLGEVREPGRTPLSSNSDRILDVIAASGGVARPPEDVQVTIQRDGESFTAPLTSVTTEFAENIRLSRGDVVNLVYKPRRYSTFGALGAVSQTEMGAGPLSLAGAISKVSGLDTNSANARAVLVFRFERPEIAEVLGVTQAVTPRGVPVVYRLNLEEAEGFFIANNFQVQPDDILYVPRSGSAELGKFFTLVRTITGVIYDISVTNTISRNN